MTGPGGVPHRGRFGLPPSTALAAGAVVLLAASALWSPPREAGPDAELLLVVDPLAALRGEPGYEPLAAWLGRGLDRPLRALVVRRLADVLPGAWNRVGLVLCPDGVALGIPGDAFTTVAAARRPAPQNLRPRSVLVYRLAAGLAPAPWLTAPARTILGDSLSLAGCGVACRAGDRPWRGAGRGRVASAVGADPYDHGPVLQALSLGCFDYALVREWTARDWSRSGMLDPAVWGIAPLSSPLPDVVVMVSRNWPPAGQMRAGELLVSLGRRQEAGASGDEARALAVLGRIGLAGFNPLLEPDFELTRRQFADGWPRERP